MKNKLILYLFVLFLCNCIQTAAQQKKESEIRFYLKPLETTAQYGRFAEKDQSGNLFAITRIISTNNDDLNKYTFDFGDPVHKDAPIIEDGKRYLYVQKDAKWVTIEKVEEGRKTIIAKRHILGMTVQAGHVYEMEIGPENRNIPMKMVQFNINPVGSNAIVMIKSTEKNAQEELFGVADRNGIIAKTLKEGEYTYKVVSDKYLLSDGKLIMGNNSITLTPDTIKTDSMNMQIVQFEIEPKNADAVIIVKNEKDGSMERLLHRTDSIKNTLEYGTYTYQIISNDFHTSYGAFTLNDRNRTHMERDTLELNSAEITLNVDADADILINGENKGSGSLTKRLKSGTYLIECHQANHRNSTQYITVVSNKDTVIQLNTPTPIRGKISVISDPLGAKVSIDGKDYGVTPCEIDTLIGNYTLLLSMADYKQDTLSVEVKENETSSYNKQLVPITKITINSNPSKATLYLNGRRKGKTPYSLGIASGEYTVKLTKRKYHDFEKRVRIDNSTPIKTFIMSRKYILDNTVYAGVSGQAGMGNGAGVCIGGYFNNFNIEAGAVYYLTKEELYYNGGDAPKLEELAPCSYGVKLGYGISLAPRWRITPQIGINLLKYSGDIISSDNICMTLGARAEYAISPYFGLSITPEGQFAISKDETSVEVTKISSKIKNILSGANIRIGMYLNM